jgi:hypothetical protein
MTKKLYTTGNWYVFKIIKIIDITDEGSYYVLKDINKNNFLLPLKYYHSYNIKIQDIIICRIDKINCNGRLFLEPVHPYYREGEIYNFKFEKISSIIDKFKIQREVMVTKDVFGNDAYVLENFVGIHNDGTVKCKIERIKKGRLYLRGVMMCDV